MCMYGDLLMDRPADGYCGKYELDKTTGLELNPKQPSSKLSFA